MYMPKYAIFRVAKLKQGRAAGGFARSWRHLENHEKTATISHPEWSQYNKTAISEKVRQRGISAYLRDIIKQHNKVSAKKLRSDAAIGAEMLFSYSQKDDNGKPTPLDLDFVEKYEKRMIAFVKQRFGDFRVLRLDRHVDEESVHWHLVGVCLNKDRRINTKSVLGGPYELRAHQTAFAECVKDLGLVRGISKELTKAKHISKDKYNRKKYVERLSKEEAEKLANDILGDER